MASVSKREWTHNGETKSAYVVRFTDHEGKRRMRTFERKKEADRFRSSVEVGAATGEHVTTQTNVLMRRLCEEFLRSREDMVRAGSLKSSTMINLRATINHDIIPFMGTMKVDAIRYAEIEAYYRWMRDTRKLSPGTITDRLFIFSRIFEYGRKKGYGQRAQIADAVKDFTSGKHGKVEQFTEEQVAKLLETAATRVGRAKKRPNAITRCVVSLAVYGGLRIGEILALRRESFDPVAGCVRVDRGLTRDKTLTTPKTRSSVRTVHLPKLVVQLLEDFLLAHFVYNELDLIFTSGSGEPLTFWHFSECYWNPLLVRAGLKESTKGKGLHFHALRHFHASWLLDRNEPIAVVSARLGHANAGITMEVYAHAIRRAEETRPSIERMAAEIGGRDMAARQGDNIASKPLV